jgi:hypothetical protein
VPVKNAKAEADRGTPSRSGREADHIVRVRQRVADGAYNDARVVAHVARRMMEGGELH